MGSGRGGGGPPGKNNHKVNRLLLLPRSLGVNVAAELWPLETWLGALLAKARSVAGGRLVGRFLNLWQPLAEVLAVPSDLLQEKGCTV